MNSLESWKQKNTFNYDFGDGLVITGVRVDLADLSLRLTEGLDYLSRGIKIGTTDADLPPDKEQRMALMATVLESKRKFYFAILRRTTIAPRLTEEDWSVLEKAIPTEKLEGYLEEVTRTSDSAGIKSDSQPESESQISVGTEPSVPHTT